ncbi:DUF3261 domain-containing protein [Vibrio gallicus]|uniref:DUF3261 domain-containing protein n=1 Tax=Vibrio gallicus TaxID=190897 RepID=UPI0021C42A84|nr:DUF3261 domain-containing protein [Vibrio gallicus]
MRIRLVKALALMMAITLGGCALAPKQSTPYVEVEPGVQVDLPLPEQLGYQLTASQLITAQWGDDQQQNQQLPVQLQVTDNKLVLAGFSSWGTRLLSLTYSDGAVTTEVMKGLDGVLPEPQQVLFNLMLTLWPASSWEAPLNKVKWHIIDTQTSRTIQDEQGNDLIVIQYQQPNRLDGDIRFHNIKQGYSITIQTLQHQISQP